MLNKIIEQLNNDLWNKEFKISYLEFLKLVHKWCIKYSDAVMWSFIDSTKNTIGFFNTFHPNENTKPIAIVSVEYLKR